MTIAMATHHIRAAGCMYTPNGDLRHSGIDGDSDGDEDDNTHTHTHTHTHTQRV